MILLAVLLSLSVAQPVDCGEVRAKVAELGKVKAYAMALAHGYSPKEISRIRKMCGV